VALRWAVEAADRHDVIFPNLKWNRMICEREPARRTLQGVLQDQVRAGDIIHHYTDRPQIWAAWRSGPARDRAQVDCWPCFGTARWEFYGQVYPGNRRSKHDLGIWLDDGSDNTDFNIGVGVKCDDTDL
jgi:hypothetical protein